MPTNADNALDVKNKVAVVEVVSECSAVLHFGNRDFPAVIGRSDVRADKREGDGATPAGLLSLRRVFYRADRIQAPKTYVPCEPISENDGWCDDMIHSDYNRLIRLPHPASHENLWLDDHVYDLIGVLGYNDDPIIPGRGSAIFLHVARSNTTPTAGCIALSLEDLSWILEEGLQGVYVKISSETS